MSLRFTQRLAEPHVAPQLTLALTAEDRTRSRHYFQTEEGQGLYLRLPRGTVLRHGDVLQSEDGTTYLKIVAKPEPVMIVTAKTPLDLLRAAYHLGNRHVPLEVTVDYLRLSPDPVLQSMLEQMGLQIETAILPFEPEAGAYERAELHSHSHHHHSHDHSHNHNHNHSHDHGYAAPASSDRPSQLF
ncbi:MAG: urease accessory protein UreE [Synechococcales cyanobacterium M58_A2018_015]|nr:urease accessory protein UreE [Synechococcales cyanobacterium M58_A2018_015]